MKQYKTECNCDCHFGAKCNHSQYHTEGGYQPSKCACEIEGNPNFVPEEIRKGWK